MKPTELELLYRDTAAAVLNERVALEDRERLLRLSLSAAYALGSKDGAKSMSDELLAAVGEERT